MSENETCAMTGTEYDCTEVHVRGRMVPYILPVSTTEGQVTFICNIDDCTRLDHQVAGHGRDDELGIYKHPAGFILKYKQNDIRGHRELNFYKNIFKDDPNQRTSLSPNTIEILKELIPQFYGIATLKTSLGNRGEYFMLDDVVDKYMKPCVLDLKIGYRTWSRDASIEKIDKEKQKYLGTKESLGLSLAGMYYFNTFTNETIVKERHYGRNLNHQSFFDALREFFNCDNTVTRVLLTQAAFQLRKIVNFFENQAELAFYGSSILFGYDANYLINDCADVQLMDEFYSPIRIKMIDFAHIEPLAPQRRDENYLHGLRHLVNIFEQLKG